MPGASIIPIGPKCKHRPEGDLNFINHLPFLPPPAHHYQPMRLSWLVAVVTAWLTLYSYNAGKAYLELASHQVVKLDFDVLGKFAKSSSYNTGDTIKPIAAAPANGTYFVLGDALHALYGDDDGMLAVARYHDDSDEWDVIDGIDTSHISDTRYFANCSVLTVPDDNQTTYIYGGDVPKQGVLSRLLSLDLQDLKFSNISTATQPQPFLGAAQVLAPNPQTNLVIGGELAQGWLNMFQIATWDFQAGWLFRQVEPLDTSIELRRGALALPVFGKVDPRNVLTDLKVLQVVLIGGDIANRPASPSVARLQLDQNLWQWHLYPTDILGFVGAATIFNTLVTVNSTKLGLKLQLYDAISLELVSSVKENFRDKLDEASKAQKKVLTQTKAILGTVVPIAALLLLGIAGMVIYRHHRKQKDAQKLETDVDSYNFDYYEKPENPFVLLRHLTQLTLDDGNDDALFSLWMRKRQQYEALQQGHGQNGKLRNLYLASNDTLGGSDDETELLTKPGPAIIHKPPRPLRKLFLFVELKPDVLNRKQLTGPSKELLQSDDYVDAQVLVSSKRRLVLRVMNPDDASDVASASRLSYVPEVDLSEDSAELLLATLVVDDESGTPITSSKSIRQRIPLGRPLDDDN